MMITFISIICCQPQISFGQFNLYNTETNLIMNAFGHDCLHYTSDILDESITPFCIRPETEQQSDDDNKSCYGEKKKHLKN